ncbi:MULTISPECIES: hypothetical protein [unclassified Gordonia (in: high G+C Gram-positive bacteria)]|uniref:hypothetical protein n=1 Tax=unclassified Gordonia (in: high G+C Gram-positive bacteria) TaxID=2657482 RepID=UPI001CF9420E|nr:MULTISPECIES: hypothetical protein [unclassified Gordonia (in: high G+C Gram-positive bacteria)]MCT1353837.1 hypothetical protein [Gordonia sp. p3-SID1431]UCZ91265.1 hypothetical protein LEL84_06295 [Gordonia sp. WA4-43]
MRRAPRHNSDRIGVINCSWKRHSDLAHDIGRLRVDKDTWVAIKAQLRRAAIGTIRDEDWEYPCESTRGAIGEIRYDEEAEVEAIYSDRVITETTTVNYRVYFNEPVLCPEELWGMGAGAKSLHPDYVGTEQQADIDVAVGRTNSTSATGRELLTFPV